MAKAKQIKLTLKKSLIGRNPKHRVIVRTLKLGKVNSSSVLPDNDCVRGMINKVNYLLQVEECK